MDEKIVQQADRANTTRKALLVLAFVADAICVVALGRLVGDPQKASIALAALFVLLMLSGLLVAADLYAMLLRVQVIQRKASDDALRAEVSGILQKHLDDALGVIREDKFRCEILDSRAAYYRKCKELVSKADEILDTTWGPDPPPPSDEEIEARDEYIEEQGNAAKRGASYKEMFTESPSTRARIKKAAVRQEGRANYQHRVHRALNHYSLLDFMVVGARDESKQVVWKTVILSQIDVQPPMFLVVYCAPIAEIFRRWFEHSWNQIRR